MAKSEFSEDLIEKYDKFDVLKQINYMPDGLIQGYNLSDSIHIDKRPERIVLCGAGRSAHPAGVLKTFLSESNTQFEVYKGYDLPSHVNEEDLVVCISYDGDDDGAVSSLKKAIFRKCQAVSMSRGGRLSEISRDSGSQHIKLPGGFRSGFVFGHVLGVLIGVMQQAELIRGVGKVLQSTANSLRKLSFESPSVKLAEKIEGTTPVIYAGEEYYPLAERWRSQINAVAGKSAFCSSINEASKSGVEAFGDMVEDYFLIILSSPDYLVRVKKKVDLIKKISSREGLNVVEIAVKGESKLTRLLSGILMGDLASYYLALKMGRNPAVTDKANKIKEMIGPYV